MDMNTVTLVGRLAEDVYYNEGQNGGSSRAVGRLIVNRLPSADGQRRYDAISFVAWGKHADNLARWTSKGKELGLIGEIRTNGVAPKNANEEWKNYTEVLVRHISYGRDSKSAKVMKALGATGTAVSGASVGSNPLDSIAALAAAIRQNPELEVLLSKTNSSVEVSASEDESVKSDDTPSGEVNENTNTEDIVVNDPFAEEA